MPFNPSGVGLNIAFKRQLPVHPTFDTIAQNYDRFRIPRPPEFDPEGTSPGKICWGTVGDMPSPEPLPTTNLVAGKEHWVETSRVSDPVRVENPDDPSQYVMEDRPKQIMFNKTTQSTPTAPNTYDQPAPGMSDYTVAEQEGFVPDDGAGTSTGGAVTMQYQNPGYGYGPR